MISDDGTEVICDRLGCDRRYKNHYWGKVKAAEDWFTTKTGKAFCPDHHPEWVAAWRARLKKNEH